MTKGALEERIRKAIRDVPDFPKPGIGFKDITPVLADPVLFRAVTDALAMPFANDGITHVIAVESRGFILGAPVAHDLHAGFVPVRKKGKLPYRTERVEYALEYGTDTIEMHIDAITRNSRVLIVDDVLATGGTASASCELAGKVGATVVGLSFLIELSFLNGAPRLNGRRHTALVTY